MSEFILILVFYSSGAAATSILFPSEKACEVAKTKALKELTPWTSEGRAVCVPRGTP